MAKKKRRDNSPRLATQQRVQGGGQPPGVVSFEQTIEQVQWSGPLPDAATLERYENLLPGAAERILAMAEKQASHRHELESLALTTGTKRAHHGLWLGAVIVLVGMLIGAFLIWNGRETEGFVLVIGQLAVIASSFVYSHLRQGKPPRRS